MSRFARAIAAIAAVVIFAAASLVLLPKSPSAVGGPATATPSPSDMPNLPVGSPSSSSPIGCEDGLPGCAGPLSAAGNRSRHFDPRLFFNVPAGWSNVIDDPTIYKLDRTDAHGQSILVWSKASIALQSDSCAPTPKPRAGSSAADWIAFVTSDPGLESTKPTTVDLDGSKGWAVDLTVAPAWASTCPNHVGPYAMLLINGLGGEYGVPSGQRLHLVVVDNVRPNCDGAVTLACTKTVVIEVYGPSDPGLFDSSTVGARSVVDTFSFGCGVAFRRACLN